MGGILIRLVVILVQNRLESRLLKALGTALAGIARAEPQQLLGEGPRKFRAAVRQSHIRNGVQPDLRLDGSAGCGGLLGRGVGFGVVLIRCRSGRGGCRLGCGSGCRIGSCFRVGVRRRVPAAAEQAEQEGGGQQTQDGQQAQKAASGSFSVFHVLILLFCLGGV